MRDREEIELLILMHLEKAEDTGLRFSELLEKTQLSRTTLSAYLKELFKRKLIDRNYLTKRFTISPDGLEVLRILKIKKGNILRVSEADIDEIPKLIKEKISEETVKVAYAQTRDGKDYFIIYSQK